MRRDRDLVQAGQEGEVVEVAGGPEQQRRAEQQPRDALGPDEEASGEADAAGGEEQAVVDPGVEEAVEASLTAEQRLDRVRRRTSRSRAAQSIRPMRGSTPTGSRR